MSGYGPVVRHGVCSETLGKVTCLHPPIIYMCVYIYIQCPIEKEKWLNMAFYTITSEQTILSRTKLRNTSPVRHVTCQMYLCCWSFSGCGRGFSICGRHLVMRCYRNKSYWDDHIKHEIFSELFDIFKDLCQKIFRHKNVNQTILCRILYHMTRLRCKTHIQKFKAWSLHVPHFWEKKWVVDGTASVHVLLVLLQLHYLATQAPGRFGWLSHTRDEVGGANPFAWSFPNVLPIQARVSVV